MWRECELNAEGWVNWMRKERAPRGVDLVVPDLIVLPRAVGVEGVGGRAPELLAPVPAHRGDLHESSLQARVLIIRPDYGVMDISLAFSHTSAEIL